MSEFVRVARNACELEQLSQIILVVSNHRFWLCLPRREVVARCAGYRLECVQRNWRERERNWHTPLLRSERQTAVNDLATLERYRVTNPQP